jgi:hypothetical protein
MDDQVRQNTHAAVALANKTVRMAWAMMKHDADYDPEFAAS